MSKTFCYLHISIIIIYQVKGYFYYICFYHKLESYINNKMILSINSNYRKELIYFSSNFNKADINNLWTNF